MYSHLLSLQFCSLAFLLPRFLLLIVFFRLLSPPLSWREYSKVRSYFILLGQVANFSRLREILLILPIFVNSLSLVVPWNFL